MRNVPRAPFLLTVAALTAAVAWAGASLIGVVTVKGGSSGDALGECVAALGDVDDDGVPDFVVGSGGGGYAKVISGADGTTIRTHRGSAGDLYGYAVARAGDVDSDGYDDVIVGAPQEFDPWGSQTGAVHVYSGKNGSTLTDFYGDGWGDWFGCAVAGVDDQDGDGRDDVIVGAKYAYDYYYYNGYTGMVKVVSPYYGWAIQNVYGSYDGDEFGASVCGLGDVDGDGSGDFAVGAPYGYDWNWYRTGNVRIVNGRYGWEITRFNGSQDYESFGTAVADAGDVDGDGYRELAVGAEWGYDGNWNQTGYVRLFSFSWWGELTTLYGEDSYGRFGRSVAGGGDIDGDGTPDLVIGAPDATNDDGDATGAVLLVSGYDGATLATLHGSSKGDRFGTSVAVIGDVGGEGKADVVVGAPGDDDGGTDAGLATLFAGVPPKGTVVIDADAHATASRDVTLAFTWTDGSAEVVEFRVRDAAGDWGEWTALESSVSWTLPEGDGVKTVEAQFRDADGESSEVASDDIVLDATPPTGSVSVSGGATWWNVPTVNLDLTWADDGSGVTFVRARNAGGEFGDWRAVTSSLPWTLAAGSGVRTAEVQFVDAVGNLSEVCSASVSIDLDAPTASLKIDGDAEFATKRAVTLSLTANDVGGSGLFQMRVREGGATTWGVWKAPATTMAWTFPRGDGPKSVEAQFRDLAGNESPVVTDSIFLDENAPSIRSLTVHAWQPFYLAGESVAFDLVHEDVAGGSGVVEARISWNAGVTWGPWKDVSGGGLFVPSQPTVAGESAAVAMVRDRAGNVSIASQPASLYFLEQNLRDARTGGTCSGSMADLKDVDAVAVNLVRDDVLSISLKGVPSPIDASFVLCVDLIGPDGARHAIGGLAAVAKAPRPVTFTAPLSGRYVVVLHHADDVGAATGTYSLKLGVKHSKWNGAGKGQATGGSFTFEAADGASFSATLKGAGLDPASVRIEGPDGTVAATLKGRKGTYTVKPVVLSAGTGTYTVRYTAAGPVKFTWRAPLPKANAKISE